GRGGGGLRPRPALSRLLRPGAAGDRAGGAGALSGVSRVGAAGASQGGLPGGAVDRAGAGGGLAGAARRAGGVRRLAAGADREWAAGELDSRRRRTLIARLNRFGTAVVLGKVPSAWSRRRGRWSPALIT